MARVGSQVELLGAHSSVLGCRNFLQGLSDGAHVHNWLTLIAWPFAARLCGATRALSTVFGCIMSKTEK